MARLPPVLIFAIYRSSLELALPELDRSTTSPMPPAIAAAMCLPTASLDNIIAGLVLANDEFLIVDMLRS